LVESIYGEASFYTLLIRNKKILGKNRVKKMAGNLRNFSSDAALSAGQRRLYELIDSSLIEFGSLESRQKAIVSPVKELKIGKD